MSLFRTRFQLRRVLKTMAGTWGWAGDLHPGYYRDKVAWIAKNKSWVGLARGKPIDLFPYS